MKVQQNPPATETNLIDTVPADFLTLGGIFGGMYTTPEGGVLNENQEVLRNALERVSRLSMPCGIPPDARWSGRSPGPAAAPKEDRQKFLHRRRIQDSKAVRYRLCSESPLRRVQEDSESSDSLTRYFKAFDLEVFE